MFTKILIANRGEIAVRIIQACKELGIRTVAVYSEADKDSLHVRFADEAVCIGPAIPSASYLNIPAIISAAEITDADAIHPGYGFLAENANFAEICEASHITFIGPTPKNIRLLGDKMAAKETMQKAGLPVIPGSNDVIKTKEEALKIARQIQYPVIIKATAGGGGRGMRICEDDARLIETFTTAQAEAQAAFDVQDVYMEKYIEEPRHIEFQVMADHYGNVVHLGERDCSIQRRHQKLLEESPSTALNAELRQKIGELVVKGVKAAEYRSVGTIELLLDKYRNFYFMEMNTRIQVEHPVTEMITGIDLIKEQIKIANNEELNVKQDEIKMFGAAIECRINAEDPLNNFMPSPGIIENLHLPGGPRIRVDTHVYQGYTISPYYDSLVAKLIVHRENRQEAIKTMSRALNEFFITPIKTTIPFHLDLLRNPLFQNGEISTQLIENLMKSQKEK
jgi:acetyl-CoA carboxylase biotin carboxylase subunit